MKSEMISSERLSLSAAQQLKPGLFSKADVLRTLGTPDKVILLKKESASIDSCEAWLYLNQAKDSTRISVLFDQSSILSETNWFTSSADPEANLQNALGRYTSGNFVRVSIPWDSGHSSPNEEVYQNSDLGIKIVYAKGNQFVESIVFTQVVRSPTAVK